MLKQLLLPLLLFFAVTVSAQNWQTDIDEAKAKASAENKKIILVFQGSDWCAPCIKLEREIWSSEKFKEYAKEHFVMLKADFPRRKKNMLSEEQQNKNNKLAEKYNLHGYFPFIVVLDKDGNILGTTGYKKMSPEEYIKLLSSF